jgi:uncharacterized protein (TIGR00369 family)
MSSDDEQGSLDRLISELARPPFHGWLKPTAVSVDVEHRQIEISVTYRPELSHDSRAGIFHGGVIAALVDITGYAAVAIWNDIATPTMALHVEYLRPAVGDELRARGMLRRMGRAVARVDVEVSAAGSLVALGRASYSTARVRR